MSRETKLTPSVYLSPGVKYDEHGGMYIWRVRNGAIQMVMDIQLRGWGNIQNIFDTMEEAEAFQDEVGVWIADAINEKLKQEQ